MWCVKFTSSDISLWQMHVYVYIYIEMEILKYNPE